MSGKYPWPEDEGETGYPQYGMAYGGYQPEAAPQYSPKASVPTDNTATTNPNPYIAAAGLGLQAVGTGINAYGAYQQYKDAQENQQKQEDEFAFDKAITLQDRERMEEERRRRAGLEAGNCAGDYLQQARSNYGGYNAMRGA